MKLALGRCWVDGSLVPNNWGYSQITVNGHKQVGHRLAYEALVGLIPAGMQIDHVCRNSACYNPAHLEPVTPKENVKRGSRGDSRTHCPVGHLLGGENRIISHHGRACRTCNNRRSKERYWRRKAQEVKQEVAGEDSSQVEGNSE